MNKTHDDKVIRCGPNYKCFQSQRAWEQPADPAFQTRQQSSSRPQKEEPMHVVTPQRLKTHAKPLASKAKSNVAPATAMKLTPSRQYTVSESSDEGSFTTTTDDSLSSNSSFNSDRMNETYDDDSIWLEQAVDRMNVAQ